MKFSFENYNKNLGDIDMENIIWNEKNDIPYLTFPSFERLGVRHACSTKSGGVSKGACAAMNMSFSRGDVHEDVLANHRLFAQVVGYNRTILC